MSYNELWLVIDGIPMVKILEVSISHFHCPQCKKKTERNVSLWFEGVGFLACIKHFMGLVDRIEGRKLTHMRYNEQAV